MLLLRDRRSDFEAVGVALFGIPRDSPWSHVAWRAALDLELPLLSDWNGDAVRGFGIGRDYHGLNEIPERSAFLLDADGVVRGASRYESGELPDIDELLAAARGASA
jgi:glutaredoxin-dependent peroxiredoxin